MDNEKHTTIYSFGDRLAALRNACDLSQATAASAAGLSVGYYRAIESNNRLPPPAPTVARILKALGCAEPETTQLQNLAATERVDASVVEKLPVDVQKLIADIKIHGHTLPSRFVHALRSHLRDEYFSNSQKYT